MFCFLFVFWVVGLGVAFCFTPWVLRSLLDIGRGRHWHSGPGTTLAHLHRPAVPVVRQPENEDGGKTARCKPKQKNIQKKNGGSAEQCGNVWPAG